VFLANDVLTQKQVACKIVDLRKNAVELDKQDISLDRPHRIEVQAFAEQKKGVTEVRKKLIREVEILSKLGHVGTQPSRAPLWLMTTAKHCYSLQSFSYATFSVSWLVVTQFQFVNDTDTSSTNWLPVAIYIRSSRQMAHFLRIFMLGSSAARLQLP
jgi:hypothetical protein